MSAPVLSGDLRAFPLPDILLMISTNHKTGVLRCMRPGATKSVEWEDGEIVFARSSMPGDRLGAFLLARGTISAEQIQEANPMVGAPDRLGKALVRTGALTPSEMWAAVQGQIKEIVYSLFHWREGLFEFREGPPASEKIALDINVTNLIMEGTRELLKEIAVDPEGRIDRRILLANVADYPPGQRARLLQGALEKMLRLLIDELRDRIPVDDISAALDAAG